MPKSRETIEKQIEKLEAQLRELKLELDLVEDYGYDVEIAELLHTKLPHLDKNNKWDESDWSNPKGTKKQILKLAQELTKRHRDKKELLAADVIRMLELLPDPNK